MARTGGVNRRAHYAGGGTMDRRREGGAVRWDRHDRVQREEGLMRQAASSIAAPTHSRRPARANALFRAAWSPS